MPCLPGSHPGFPCLAGVLFSLNSHSLSLTPLRQMLSALWLLGVVSGLCAPSKRCTEFLIPSSCECDLILKLGLNPGVFVRRETHVEYAM